MTRIYRSIQEPIRQDPSFDERWNGPDKGLITCWEVGRRISLEKAKLAGKARKGELPILGWKGGVSSPLGKPIKYGTLEYLAEWQGLRGNDLDIDTKKESERICTKTQVKVIYSIDKSRL